MKTHNNDRVEMFLHPEWFQDHKQIRHTHLRGGMIEFRAWDMDNPLPKTFTMEKSEIMSHTSNSEFYKAYESEWKRLVTK